MLLYIAFISIFTAIGVMTTATAFWREAKATFKKSIEKRAYRRKRKLQKACAERALAEFRRRERMKEIWRWGEECEKLKNI